MIGWVAPVPATSWPSMTCVISYPMGFSSGVGCLDGLCGRPAHELSSRWRDLKGYVALMSGRGLESSCGGRRTAGSWQVAVGSERWVGRGRRSEVVALRGEVLLVLGTGLLRGLEASDGADGHVPPADAGRVRAVQVRVHHDRGRLGG